MTRLRKPKKPATRAPSARSQARRVSGPSDGKPAVRPEGRSVKAAYRGVPPVEHRFKPGNPGGPGRPRIPENVKQWRKIALERIGHPDAQRQLNEIWNWAQVHHPELWFRMYAFFWEQGCGKAPQRLDLGTDPLGLEAGAKAWGPVLQERIAYIRELERLLEKDGRMRELIARLAEARKQIPAAAGDGRQIA